MNIAIILEATLGGTRKHVLDLLEALDKDKTNQYCFVYSSKRADSIFTETMASNPFKQIKLLELPLSNSLFSFFKNVYLLRRFFKKNKIHLLHLHGAIAGAIGRVAGMKLGTIHKIVYSPHGGVLHKINGSIIGKFYQVVEKWLVFDKCFFIAVSTNEKEEIVSKLNVAISKIRIIPNGISLFDKIPLLISASAIQKERELKGFCEDDLLLIYPALFLEAKGHVNFVNAVINGIHKLEKRVKIIFTGDGPLENSIRQIVNTAGLSQHFFFEGFVTNINLYYQICDAVILMSNSEAFGYVLLEAMKFKKPIFATSVGGIKDIVQSGRNGKLYNPMKLHELVPDLNWYSYNKELLKVMGSIGHEILEDKFKLDASISAIRRIYEEY